MDVLPALGQQWIVSDKWLARLYVIHFSFLSPERFEQTNLQVTHVTPLAYYSLINRGLNAPPPGRLGGVDAGLMSNDI